MAQPAGPRDDSGEPGRDGQPHTLRLEGGATVRGRAVVIATGASYRRIGVDAIEALVGRGVNYGAATSVARDLRDREVYVVGGGNSAGQAAVHLARFAKSVTICIRRESLASTMSAYLIREVEANPVIASPRGVLAVDALVQVQNR